ncbi:putative uncharacterized protein C8orf49 [Plecturocebus cupreus]
MPLPTAQQGMALSRRGAAPAASDPLVNRVFLSIVPAQPAGAGQGGVSGNLVGDGAAVRSRDGAAGPALGWAPAPRHRQRALPHAPWMSLSPGPRGGLTSACRRLDSEPRSKKLPFLVTAIPPAHHVSPGPAFPDHSSPSSVFLPSHHRLSRLPQSLRSGFCHLLLRGADADSQPTERLRMYTLKQLNRRDLSHSSDPSLFQKFALEIQSSFLRPYLLTLEPHLGDIHLAGMGPNRPSGAELGNVLAPGPAKFVVVHFLANIQSSEHTGLRYDKKKTSVSTTNPGGAAGCLLSDATVCNAVLGLEFCSGAPGRRACAGCGPAPQGGGVPFTRSLFTKKKKKKKKKKKGRVWWLTPVIPAFWEAETGRSQATREAKAGELLEPEKASRGCSEPRSLHCTPAWTTEGDSVSKKKSMFVSKLSSLPHVVKNSDSSLNCTIVPLPCPHPTPACPHPFFNCLV